MDKKLRIAGSSYGAIVVREKDYNRQHSETISADMLLTRSFKSTFLSVFMTFVQIRPDKTPSFTSMLSLPEK